MHDIIKASVFAAIGVLVFASLLVPVVGDAMEISGDSITYDNPLGGSYKLNDSTSSVVFERLADDTIKVNDETITKSDGFALVSDSISVYVAFGGRWYVVAQEHQIFEEAAAGTVPFSISYENGTVTFTDQATNATVTDTYTWVYSPDTNGNWNTAYFNGRSYYVNSINDIICSGYYSTGDNDTGYIFKDGKLTLDQDYAGSVDYTLTKVDGTTDVYIVSGFSINVGEESFIPWCSLVKTQVTGHQTSGALYDMLGILPIAVICALIFGVLGAALYSRIE